MMTVDYPSIWREVADFGLRGESPVSEFDKTSYLYLYERIQIAARLLRNSELNKEQRRRIRSKIKVMLARLARVQELAKRVDATIP